MKYDMFKKVIIVFISISALSAVVQGQLAEDVVEDDLVNDIVVSDGSDVPNYVNYETSPIYGNSSSRGVSIFSVPGQASIGYSSVSRFSRYSTGWNSLILSDPVRQSNPLRYTTRLPVSGYGSRRNMPYSLATGISTRVGNLRASDMSKLSSVSLATQSESTVNTGRNEDYYTTNSTLRIPSSVANSALYNQITRSNSSRMMNQKKVLLLSNRSGNLSFSKNDMKYSLQNRASRLSIKNNAYSGYSTSAVLGIR